MKQAEPSKGIRRLINATRYSIQGIRAAWRHEAAFRQEAIAALVCIPLAFWVGTTLLERALLIFSILMILIVELLNSAIEAAVDRIGEERHTLSGRAKNMGSAAVMLSLVAAGIVWAMVIWQRCGW